MTPRHLLRDDDLNVVEQAAVLIAAGRLAADPDALAQTLRGHGIGLLFEKPSLRTRVSSEMACHRLGAWPLVLRGDEMRLGTGEPETDIARVLGGYLSLLSARVFDHELLEAMAGTAALSIVNALSDRFHPLQALADLLTLQQEWGDARGRRLVYVGDADNNVASSLLLACSLAGVSVGMCCPDTYAPRPDVLADARRLAAGSGATVTVGADPAEILPGADAVYTDVFVSMGDEAEAEARHAVLAPYQLDAAKLALAGDDAIVLHCLPAHRGEEIAADVIDGPQSRVIRQAHNRQPAAAAAFAFLLAPEVVLGLGEA